MKPEIIHHHLIYQAKVGRSDLGKDAEEILRTFLLDLIKEIDMQILIEPVFKFSHNDAWTGLMGIITSHISFHYWTIEQYVQLDIYSCKEFDIEKTKTFLDNFWKAAEQKVIFLNREQGKEFLITNIT